MKVNKRLLAFFAEEEGAVGVGVHEEVFGEDGGGGGVAEDVEVGFEVGVGVGVVGAQAPAGEVGLGGGERAGSGADTIKKGWADNKWPAPEIKEHFGQNDDRVELTLRIGQSTSSPGKGTESELKSTLKSGQKIVDLMRENPSITIAELVLRLGLSRSGVNKQIAKLKAAGVIEREGSDKGGYWLVIDK